MRTYEVGKALKLPHMWRLKRYAVTDSEKYATFVKVPVLFFLQNIKQRED